MARIKLLESLINDGTIYEIGKEIEVNDTVAENLVERKVAEIVETSTKTNKRGKKEELPNTDMPE